MLNKEDWLKAWGELYESITVLEGKVDEKLALSEQKARKKLAPDSSNTAVENGSVETTSKWSERIKKDLSSRKRGKFLGRGTCGSVHLLDSPTGGSPLVAKFANAVEHETELGIEAQIYSDLGDHPSLPKCLGVVDMDVDGKTHKTLILEAVVGDTQTKVIDSLQTRYENGKVSHEEYWGTMQYMQIKLLQGLAFMEEKGFVHSDIKPDNVMIDGTTGDLKIIDLGGSVRIGDDRKASTPGYAPPEKEGLTGKFDVYSTGKVADNSVKSDWIDNRKKKGKGVDNKDYKDEYQKFMEWLTNPDPKLRPTATQALTHPFLKDVLLDEDNVRNVIKGTLDKVRVTEGFTKQAWDRTMEDAVSKNALPVNSAPEIQAVSRALEKLSSSPAKDWKTIRREPDTWTSKSEAMNAAMTQLQIIRNGVSTLKERDVKEGDRDVKKTGTADVVRYLKEIAWAAEAMIVEITEAQKTGAPVLTVNDFADRWRQVKANAEVGYNAAVENINKNIKGVKAIKEFISVVLKDKKQKLSFDQRTGIKKPLDENDYERALEEVNGDNKALVTKLREQLESDYVRIKKGFEEFLGFTENFSGALKSFVNANTRNIEERRNAAMSIAQNYFQHAHNAQAVLERFNPSCKVDITFLKTLELEINDLTFSISHRK